MRNEYTIKCNYKFLIINDLKSHAFALNQWLIFLLLQNEFAPKEQYLCSKSISLISELRRSSIFRQSAA